MFCELPILSSLICSDIRSWHRESLMERANPKFWLGDTRFRWKYHTSHMTLSNVHRPACCWGKTWRDTRFCLASSKAVVYHSRWLYSCSQLCRIWLHSQFCGQVNICQKILWLVVTANCFKYHGLFYSTKQIIITIRNDKKVSSALLGVTYGCLSCEVHNWIVCHHMSYDMCDENNWRSRKKTGLTQPC